MTENGNAEHFETKTILSYCLKADKAVNITYGTHWGSTFQCPHCGLITADLSGWHMIGASQPLLDRLKEDG